MSDIKRIALLVLIVSLFFSSFSNYVYAANDYDHDALMQYEGYAKTMYDSVIEQTTFLTGQYTDNKDYVRDSMNEIKDYADFWYDEYNDFTSSCYQSSAMNCLGEMVERGGGYALTVGDWIKNLFTNYEDTVNDTEEIHGYASYFTMDGTRLTIKDDYYFVVNDYLSRVSFGFAVNSGFSSNNGNYTNVTVSYNSAGQASTNREYFKTDKEAQARELELEAKFTSPSPVLNYLEANGFDFKIYSRSSDVVVPREVHHGDRNITTINNYLRDNSPSVVVPQPKPYLVCPDDTRIQMSVSGSTFLAVDGTVMAVSKDGTAEVNGSLCNLGWEKPIVKYNEDDKAVIETPDGREQDLETGEIYGAVDHGEGCDGVLCFLSAVTKGIAEIVGSITGLVTKVLDGILGLFVPDDLAFISEEFGRITDSLTDKIAITEDLKDMLTGMFSDDTTNPLQDITIDLPIVGKPLQFGDMSLINEGVPILKKIISAICILYTLLYVYRKITGRGGVMEK